MRHKTRGIVLNYIKYGETSIIVRIYTESFGLQSYIVNGVRSARSKSKIALFQQLTLLDLVVYHKSSATLHRIVELKCSEVFRTIPFNVKKSSIALFIAEVLSKTMQSEQDVHLFNFLQQSLLILEHMNQDYENFHLQFLIKLSRFLGFEPISGDEVFRQLHYHANNEALAREEKKILDQLMQSGYENKIGMPIAYRRDLLDLLLKFYSVHMDGLSEIRSVAVLQEVMS